MKSLTERTTKMNKRRNNLQLRRDIGGWLLILPALIVMYLLIWRPTIISFVWSLFRMKGYTPTDFIGLENYRMVLTNTQFLPILSNTVQFVIWSLIFGYLPPLIIAVILNEMVHFKNGLRVLVYLPAIIPAIAAMLMWYYIYYPDQTGLLNMLLSKFGMDPFAWLNNEKFAIPGVVIYMTWKGFPGTMLLYYASIQSVSPELYEAAIIDGAGIFKRAWNVTRPQILGMLLLNFVNQIISVFQVMQEPLAMTGGGPNGATTTLSYQLYIYGFQSGGKGTGQAMALGAITFMILLVATIFYFRLNKKVEENF